MISLTSVKDENKNNENLKKQVSKIPIFYNSWNLKSDNEFY